MFSCDGWSGEDWSGEGCLTQRRRKGTCLQIQGTDRFVDGCEGAHVLFGLGKKSRVRRAGGMYMGHGREEMQWQQFLPCGSSCLAGFASVDRDAWMRPFNQMKHRTSW